MVYLKLINAEVSIKKHAVVHCKNCVIVLRPGESKYIFHNNVINLYF
jgi:hypothetical protein